MSGSIVMKGVAAKVVRMVLRLHVLMAKGRLGWQRVDSCPAHMCMLAWPWVGLLRGLCWFGGRGGSNAVAVATRRVSISLIKARDELVPRAWLPGIAFLTMAAQHKEAFDG